VLLKYSPVNYLNEFVRKNWQSEITKKWLPGKLNVLAMDGGSKDEITKELSKNYASPETLQLLS